MAIRMKGNKFQVDVTVKGVRVPRVSRDTMVEARATEAEFKAHLLAGKDPSELVQATATAPAGQVSIATALDATIRDRWLGTKGEVTATRNAKVWCDALGWDFPVANIGPEHVTAVVDTMIEKGNSNATINRKINALGVMLGVAEDRGWRSKMKAKLPYRKEYEGRLRYFSDTEVDSLLQFHAHRPEFAALCGLGVETGMRISELLRLTKRDVNVSTNIIELQATKGNKRRSVPMTSEARYLATWLIDYNKLTHDHQKLFATPFGSSKVSYYIKAWKHSISLPEDDEACFHTLRHTCCTRLVQAGVSLPVVQNWMGHKNIETTMRYAHLAPNDLQAAVKLLEAR